MDTSSDRQRLRSKLELFAFLIGIIPMGIYLIVILLLRDILSLQLESSTLNILVISLLLVSLIQFGVGFLLENILFKQRRAQLSTNDILSKGLVIFALGEGIAVYGLVVALLGASLDIFTLFAALTIAYYLVFRGKIRTWLDYLGEE